MPNNSPSSVMSRPQVCGHVTVSATYVLTWRKCADFFCEASSISFNCIWTELASLYKLSFLACCHILGSFSDTESYF